MQAAQQFTQFIAAVIMHIHRQIPCSDGVCQCHRPIQRRRDLPHHHHRQQQSHHHHQRHRSTAQPHCHVTGLLPFSQRLIAHALLQAHQIRLGLVVDRYGWQQLRL